LKNFIYKIGLFEIEIKVSDEDYGWVRELFLRNADPLKALRDIEKSVLNENNNDPKD